MYCAQVAKSVKIVETLGSLKLLGKTSQIFREKFSDFFPNNLSDPSVPTIFTLLATCVCNIVNNCPTWLACLQHLCVSAGGWRGDPSGRRPGRTLGSCRACSRCGASCAASTCRTARTSACTPDTRPAGVTSDIQLSLPRRDMLLSLSCCCPWTETEILTEVDTGPGHHLAVARPHLVPAGHVLGEAVVEAEALAAERTQPLVVVAGASGLQAHTLPSPALWRTHEDISYLGTLPRLATHPPPTLEPDSDERDL